MHPPHPAAVVGEHAVGLEHVAVLALDADVAARQHVVDGEAEAGDRRVEPGGFLLGILGDERRHHDARLVQDDMAEADALRRARCR